MKSWTIVLAVLALAGCGGSGESAGTARTDTGTQATDTGTTGQPAQPVEIAIEVRGGQPAGGIVRSTVQKGDRVVLVVTSDVADEVHVHGYDLKRDVDAGGTVRIGFTAGLPGRFEVELEHRGAQIADLTVEP